MSALDEVPLLAERIRGGRRVEPFRGATDVPNFLRTPHGPGWALVGDAGCHKGPYLALGICDAFRDADLLAEALDDGLSGRVQLDFCAAGDLLQPGESGPRDGRIALVLFPILLGAVLGRAPVLSARRRGPARETGSIASTAAQQAGEAHR